MILTCPSCGTQYRVKDGAIPPDGRQVRCASCKHSWHQDPEITEGQPDEAREQSIDTDAAALSEQPLQPAEPETAAEIENTDDAVAATPRAEADFGSGAAVGMAPSIPVAPPSEVLHEAAPGEGPAAAVWEEDEPHAATGQGAERVEEASDYHFSPFADEAEVEERRRPWLRVLLGLLLIAAAAAAFWFLAPPEWKARLGLAGVGETPLQLMMTHSDRQRLASGQEMLSVSGRVINPTEESQQVPAIEAQLRSRSGKLVYSWTIVPPARTLPPGASAAFNSSELNVPAGGEELTISLGTRGV